MSFQHSTLIHMFHLENKIFQHFNDGFLLLLQPLLQYLSNTGLQEEHRTSSGVAVFSICSHRDLLQGSHRVQQARSHSLVPLLLSLWCTESGRVGNYLLKFPLHPNVWKFFRKYSEDLKRKSSFRVQDTRFDFICVYMCVFFI